MLNLYWWLFVIFIMVAIAVMLIDLAIGAFVLSVVLFVSINWMWHPLVFLVFWVAMIIACVGIIMRFLPNAKTMEWGRKLAKFAYLALFIVILMAVWWPLTKTPAEGGWGPVAGSDSSEITQSDIDRAVKDERDDRVAQQKELYKDQESFEKQVNRKVAALQTQADELSAQLDDVDGIEQRLVDQFEETVKDLQQRIRELKQSVS